MHDHGASATLPSSQSTHTPLQQQPLAIVGLACRLPGNCNNPKAFWDFLERGGVASRTPPETRFSIDTHYDGSRKLGTMASPGGMFISADPKDIDASFFKLSKMEATAMDPQQRQLLEVIYEGLENSGITLEAINGSHVGCFVGSYAGDYGDIQARDPENRAAAATVGIGRAMLSNRISHFLNIKGPSLTIDTACSGSLTGVDIANRYLQTGEISGAIVAGCNIYLSPEHVMDSMSVNGTASGTGKCHTFDAKADGYIKAEAVNMVYLRRLDDAIRDGDPIRAIIRGTAAGSDGWTAGIASPSSEAQATTVRQAYANAHIRDLGRTHYVECHGTGTKAGDVIEVNGIASVFQAYKSAQHPLRIGSVKSNIGHSEPAAGLSGLIKVVLSLETGVLPGNPTFETPNPNIDFEQLRVRPSRTLIQWPTSRVRRAGVNSFGYGGSNVHAIVENTTQQSTHVSSYLKDDDDLFSDDVECLRPYILPLSANDPKSLQDYAQALESHLFNPAVRLDMRDLAYTLSEKRTAHFHRSYVVARGPDVSMRSLHVGKISQRLPRIGLIFTGQGAQWPQMGKDLIYSFPVARACLLRLNDVLQGLDDAPPWDLLDKLSAPQCAEAYRHPELSQTLVTALQLAILAVLEDCGVPYHGAVGHSSGEIAGAVAAGYLTPEQAIKVAYYRGKATAQISSDVALGMMAVGLSHDKAIEYLGTGNTVQVACINSPQSITLSGDRAVLVDLEERIKRDGHFARLLAVDAAYHSIYMEPVGLLYRILLEKNCEFGSITQPKTPMFSSVTGKSSDASVASSQYWEKNMLSPVLFDSAVKQLLDSSVDILIEIGPSNALSGPVTQIKKAMDKSSVEYMSAWKRGPDAITTFCELAGKLFITGLPISLTKFNKDGGPEAPKTVIDLPNYRWNHSVKYWHESEASKDWRFRKFLHHDLLGSKVLGAPWAQPTWRKALRLDELPWLKDHKLGDNTVFPASGYVAMAIEAIYQKQKATSVIPSDNPVCNVTYHLRNVAFLRAMMLEGNGAEHQINLTLNPQHGTNGTWHEFKISTSADGVTNDHCQGLISISKRKANEADDASLRPLQFSTPAEVWYKTMRDIGYGFGPSFQKQISVESTAGARTSRSLVSLEEPTSSHRQSVYPLHPANMDSCFQAGAGSLWQGHRSTISAVLVPAMIDDLIIFPQIEGSSTAMAISSAKYAPPGRVDDPKSYKSDIAIYDSVRGTSIMQVQGLSYHRLERMPNASDEHVYTRVEWRPDISFLGMTHVQSMLQRDSAQEEKTIRNIDRLFDLITFKKPGVKVLEVNGSGYATSAWLDGVGDRTTSSTVNLVFSDSSDVQEAKARYGSSGNVRILQQQYPHSLELDELFDVLIVNSSESSDHIATMISKLRSNLYKTAYLAIFYSPANANSSTSLDPHYQRPPTPDELLDTLRCEGFDSLIPMDPNAGDEDKCSNVRCLFGVLNDQADVQERSSQVRIVTLGSSIPETEDIQQRLHAKGWDAANVPLADVAPQSTVLILDELFSPLLTNITAEQWDALQDLVARQCRILWVTQGSQMDVTNPEKSLIHGLARSISNEDPSRIFMTLDVADSTGEPIVTSIDHVLRRLKVAKDAVDADTEFVERGGVVHVARALLDDKVNAQEKANEGGAEAQLQPLFARDSCVRLVSERPGTLDSLCWSEVATVDLPLQDGEVEVELHAVSLNFKDVAISMGLVPGDERLMGLEGAGTIRRLGKDVVDLSIGQRVLVNRKGSLANRVQCVPMGQIYPLPDSMTFDEASTLSTVYSTVLYSLIDLANTKPGQSVLIHSAAGGVGLAAIDVCRYLGAEMYATVGTDEKRSFLVENYGIPSERIFSSRSIESCSQLMVTTGGRGVDVVLNSLSGEMLHESWRCVAENGVFVDIGKKDILDRASLSMEPFNRNASYRAVDMSHDCISPELKARLLELIFILVREGHIKPVHVSKTFTFDDYQSAFRYMRSGTNIGKTVITRGGASDVEVPVKPAAPALDLNPDASYLIVGGLKGLCGSLAVYLARNGAKNLVLLSRSGYDDEQSRAVLHDLRGLGVNVDAVIGDVTNPDDVERTCASASKPIRGIIQGAMVLRDKMYASMTSAEFHAAIAAKVHGTWNLHHASLKLGLTLDFFTLLSSICGVAGQKGQANYSAANVFLDAFAAHRHAQGLPACSVDLGVIEDVGYVNKRDFLARRLLAQGWVPIREVFLHRILYFSILQQGKAPINARSSAQLITGIPVPLPEQSPAQRDVRFSALRHAPGRGTGAASKDDSDASPIVKLREAWRSGLGASSAANTEELLQIVIGLACRKLMQSLGMEESMDAARPLMSYGIDSLVAVEFRNWTRTELGVEVTTLEIVGAKTLASLAELILKRGFQSK